MDDSQPITFPYVLPPDLAEMVFPYRENYRALRGFCRQKDCYLEPCNNPEHKKYPKPKTRKKQKRGIAKCNCAG